MKSILKSRKGIETAPLLFILSAVVMALTAGVVFPAMSQWEYGINEGKAMKEAMRLRDAINEIHSMGDYGTIERLDLNVPPPFWIEFEIGNRIAVCGATFEDPGNAKCFKRVEYTGSVDSKAGKIQGPRTLMLSYWPKNNHPVSSNGAGSQIFIYEK